MPRGLHRHEPPWVAARTSLNSKSGHLAQTSRRSSTWQSLLSATECCYPWIQCTLLVVAVALMGKLLPGSPLGQSESCKLFAQWMVQRFRLWPGLAPWYQHRITRCDTWWKCQHGVCTLDRSGGPSPSCSTQCWSAIQTISPQQLVERNGQH